MFELTGDNALYAAIALGYLLGSIPFGLLLTRLAGLGDVRTIGSGNIGATNVLRTGNKGLAAVTLLLDGGKGSLAVILFQEFSAETAAFAGLAAVIGHTFPVWLRFSGGKGVATSLGVLISAAWPVGLLACATWAAVAAISRYSSLAAIAALISAPFFAYFFANNSLTAAAAIIAVLAVHRHRENIIRLKNGTESKIGKAAE
jgi:glycerol-3-phosphate acyltransferase PlsY